MQFTDQVILSALFVHFTVELTIYHHHHHHCDYDHHHYYYDYSHYYHNVDYCVGDNDNEASGADRSLTLLRAF